MATMDKARLHQYIDEFIRSELVIGAQGNVTRHRLFGEFNKWWGFNIPGLEIPYNAKDELYRKLELENGCTMMSGQNTGGGLLVYGCRLKNVNYDKRERIRDVYKVRICLHCKRTDVELMGAYFEDGFECVDLNECVDYIQRGLRNGNIQVEPKVTKFSTQQFRNSSHEDELEARQRQDDEYNRLIKWLKEHEPDSTKKIHNAQVRRSRNRGAIARLQRAIISREKTHA